MLTEPDPFVVETCKAKVVDAGGNPQTIRVITYVDFKQPGAPLMVLVASKHRNGEGEVAVHDFANRAEAARVD